MDRLFVVIPAYNEETVIGNVVASVKGLFPNVIVVDDGSRDNTVRVARSAGAVVVSHPFNLGQGAALQTGITYALKQDAQYVVTFDADGQHDVRDIARLMDCLISQNVDVVLGSRFLGKTEALPLVRRLILKAAVVFTKLTTGLQLTDTHNGFRIFTRNALNSIHIRQNGMAHASELLEQISRKNLKYAEAPVSVTYTEYSLRKGQKLRGSIRILADLLYGQVSR